MPNILGPELGPGSLFPLPGFWLPVNQFLRAQIRIFRTALASFEIDNGLYPQGRNGLLELMQRPANARAWHGPYLEALPKDPWGHDYLYECPGRHNPDSYDLLSPRPDGLLGTDDDITNWDVDKQASL